MTSPYLEQPLFPLAVALRRMLDQIEAQLADEKLVAAEEERLCRRAELIRGLLAPRADQLTRRNLDRGARRGSRSLVVGCQDEAAQSSQYSSPSANIGG